VSRAGPDTVLLPPDFASETVRQLSPQENRVLGLVEQGRSTGDVAAHLGLTVNTVKAHLATIHEKLQVNSRVHAVNVALRPPTDLRRVPVADGQC
jgi:DNA-binding CsgD family transcriptional regulator